MRLCIRLLMVVLLILISVPAFAAQLLLKPSLGFKETYTDNVSPLNDPGTEDFITEVTPGLSLQADGSRLNANLGLSLQNFFSAKDSGRNAQFHNLSADTSAELIKDFAFLNMKASNSQRAVSPSGGGLLNNFNKANRTDISVWLVNPHIKKRFGRKAEGSASYSYEELSYEGASDAKVEAVQVGFKSGPSFRRISWSADYSKKSTKRGTASDYSRESSIAKASYQVYEKLSVLFRAGDERNDRSSSQSQGYRNGSYYAAGIRIMPHSTLQIDLLSGKRLDLASLSWAPSRRSIVDILWRDQKVGRNLGEVWQATLRLINRRVAWNASYLEDETSTQSSGSLGAGSQGGGQSQSGNLSSAAFPLSNERFLRKRKQMDFEYKTAKSLIKVSLYGERRVFRVSNLLQDSFGRVVSWNWRFATRTTMLLSFQTLERKYFDAVSGRSGGKVRSGSINFSRKMGQGVEGSIMARSTSQDGLVGGRSYNETRVSVGMKWLF